MWFITGMFNITENIKKYAVVYSYNQEVKNGSAC